MPAELVDLSVPIETGMPIYPGDPDVAVTAALTVTNSGVNVQRLHLGSQTGTHVDAPYHIDDLLPRLEHLPLDRFIGRAVIADARNLPPRTPIGPEFLPAGLTHGDILLIATGWSEYWGKADYLAHPYPSVGLAEAIVATGVRTVGIDALSVDRTPPPGDETLALDAHRVLCESRAVIAENLTNLDHLLDAQSQGRKTEVSLFPIRLNADGAPIRAIARIS